MAIRSPKRLRSRVAPAELRGAWRPAVLVLTLAASSTMAAPVLAPHAVPMPSLAASSEAGSSHLELYLEVTLNGMARGLHAFHEREGDLWASAEVLRRLGMALPDGSSQEQRLRALPGVDVQFDRERQQVVLVAPLAMLKLPTTVVGEVGEQNFEPTTSTGLLINYDLYGTQHESTNLSAFTELRVFSGESVLSTTELLRYSSNVPLGAQEKRAVRLDSTWSLSFPERMLTLRVGDTLTGALPWSRATRIGGIQLARNFGLQPYRQTAPLPSFMGSATLPSQVELFVNGIRHYRGQVPAGPFELHTLPSVNSSGTAQVVLTDALGRATMLDFSLYDSGRLLAAGLSDWTVDLGVVRRHYGLRSFSYGSEPVLTGTWRQGMSDQLTLEAHAEAARGLGLAGLGGVWQLGGAGLVSASWAGSRHSAGNGMQASVGWSWIRSGFNVGLSGTRTQGDYRDVATPYGSAPPKASARATMGYSAAGLGSLGLSYFYLRPAGEPASRYANLSWVRAIGHSASVSVGVNQNLGDRSDRGVYVSLNWLLGPRMNLGASVQRDAQGGTLGVLSAQQSAPDEGGWGWRAIARAGGHTPGGQAELNYLGRYGFAQAGVSDFGRGSRHAYAGASGSLVLMGGRGFASRRIDNAFAVVDTDGMAGVPVKLENRIVGETDERGFLLVVPVNAYQNNKLAIDPMQLPADVRIGSTETSFTPSDRAGSRLRFSIVPVRAASVALVDGAGRPLPMGSRVYLHASRNGAAGEDVDESAGEGASGGAGEGAVVGYDGMVYLDTLEEYNELSVRTPQGTCTARLTWHPSPAGVAQVGPLPCLP